MRTKKFPGGSVSLTEYAINTVAGASLHLAQGGRGLSTHEYTAGAMVNGRMDLIEGDFRFALIAMGQDWAHAVIEAIFALHHNEMTLPASHPGAPINGQRLFR